MRVLSINELKPLKGIRYSKPHLYRLIKVGKFPKPIELGENCIAFVESEVDAWLEAKLADRDAKAA
jgi:prophage regulatory protein